MVMSKATVLLTDSGGVQEEAPGLGKPVLVMKKYNRVPRSSDSGEQLNWSEQGL